MSCHVSSIVSLFQLEKKAVIQDQSQIIHLVLSESSKSWTLTSTDVRLLSMYERRPIFGTVSMNRGSDTAFELGRGWRDYGL